MGEGTAVAEVKKLNANEKQEVEYCIPFWLRDEQIKLAIERVKGRIEAVVDKREDPIAVVCFGPSLNDTWEEIKKFKYVISCSGSHKFLVDRGIIPTWHVEVDPRPHKVQLIGKPHKDVEYLIASTCHPAVFDHLEGYNVKLWHVFANDAEALRTLPPNEWAITGGSSVGLRTLTIARFLGFMDLHVFGMDGCEGKTGKHADVHPNQPKGYSITEYDGVTYKTTASMLECARQTFHELDEMPGTKATFYGEGLVQAMAKHYVPVKKDPSKAAIGFNKPLLISPEYRDLNYRLHRENLAYGVGAGKYADMVLKLADSIGTKSILDYGCGKGYLAKEIPFPIWEYDPCIPGKDQSPRPAELVVCIDVLEHIEPEKLIYVLDDLKRCTKKLAFFIIDTVPAIKTLADGRNTHLIQEGKDWWEDKLKSFFEVGKIIEKGSYLLVVAAPRAKTLEKSK